MYDVRGSEAKPIRQSVNLSELVQGVGGACMINTQNGHVTLMPLHTIQNSVSSAHHAAPQQPERQGTAQSNKPTNVPQSQFQSSAFKRRCIHCAFSSDSKKMALIIQETVTDSQLIIFDWAALRVEAAMFTTNVQITQASFVPGDRTALVTTGVNHWRFWRLQEGSTLKVLNKMVFNQQHVYTAHAWLSADKVVACSQEGEMYVASRAEEKIVQAEENAFKVEETGETHVTAIAPWSKGFFICASNGEMALWVRGEENTSTPGKFLYDFIRKWQPAATRGRRILACTVGNAEEILGIAMDNNNIGFLQIRSVGLNEDLNREIQFSLLLKGFHSQSISTIDVAVQRPILITASKEDSTVRLWNYVTGVCELAREYYVLEEAAIRGQARPLVSAAIHPSGYQCAVSFVDKILVHHILHDELRVAHTIELRSAYIIKYSAGGHLFFAVEAATVHIFNAYTLQKLAVQTIPDVSVRSLVLAPQDKAFAVLGSQGYIGKWFTHNQKGFGAAPDTGYDRWAGFRDIAFLPDAANEPKQPQQEEEPPKLAVVGTDGQHQRFKVVDVRNKVHRAQNYIHDDGELTSTSYVSGKALGRANLAAFVSGSHSGQLTLLSHPYAEGGIAKLNVHSAAVTQVLVSPDFRHLFSASADGSLFIFRICEERINPQAALLPGDEPAGEPPAQMDPELCQIVLVRSDDMEQWLARQRKLQADLEATKVKVEAKLQDCKHRYKLQLAEIQKQKELDIEDLRRRYGDLLRQKELQEAQNKDAMNKLERYHFEEVKEIEDLFSGKLRAEGDAYLRMEQEGLELRQAYQKRITGIKEQNEKAIRALVEEFRSNLLKVQDEMREAQSATQVLRNYYEEKLSAQYDEHEGEIVCTREQHKEKKQALEAQWNRLEGTQAEHNAFKKQLESQLASARSEFEASKEQRARSQLALDEKTKQIVLLEQENREVKEKLKRRETDLYKYKFKIKDLRKSQNVLAHRTSEMRESLKPKETQIDNLQGQLLNLEQVFSELMREIQQESERLKKSASKMKQLEKDLARQLQETENKRAVCLKFAQDVHKIVSTKDDKAYVVGMMRLNQEYVNTQSPTKNLAKKRNPEVIEDLYKILKSTEDTIGQKKLTAVKNETRAKKDIKKKTKENTQLIVDLNALKFQDKRQEINQQKKSLELEMLQFKLTRLKKQESAGRAELLALQVGNQQTTGTLDEDITGAGQNVQQRPGSSVAANAPQTRMSSATGVGGDRGRSDKGAEEDQDKQRIAELLSQLEINNEEIYKNKIEIRQIKEAIMQAVGATAPDIMMSDEDADDMIAV